MSTLNNDAGNLFMVYDDSYTYDKQPMLMNFLKHFDLKVLDFEVDIDWLYLIPLKELRASSYFSNGGISWDSFCNFLSDVTNTVKAIESEDDDLTLDDLSFTLKVLVSK